MQTESVEPKAPAYPISSVDNALRLLLLFREQETVRLTEACEYLNVAHSTAHRLLAMLIHHGFVRQDPRSRAYRPGPMLVEIGLAVVQKMDIRSQVRPLLQRLNRELGITLLVSSHLLPEVEKLATHVGIIHRGRLMFQGTIRELHQRRHQIRAVVLRTDDDRAALSLLAGAGHAATPAEDHIALPALAPEAIAALNRTQVTAGIGVHEIAVERTDLERIFMDIVEDGGAAQPTLEQAA